MQLRAFSARPFSGLLFAAIVALSPLGAGCASSGLGANGSNSQLDTASGTVDRTIAHIPGVHDTLADDLPTAEETADVATEAVAMDGTELVRGRSTVVVDAPIKQVRKAVLGFKAYPEFMPHYRSAKVLGRTPDGARDVYMEVVALHGAVKMWTRIELPKPTKVDGVETHESRFVDGNVKDFKAIWRLKKIDRDHTELSLEIFLQPDIPLPTSLINGENLKGSKQGVLAMKDRLEGRPPRRD